MSDFPQILVPYFPKEAMWLHDAAEFAEVGCSTMRLWCAEYGLGRKLCGGRPWRVSRVALAMHLDGDRAALKAYHGGDRTSALVVGYYSRFGLARALAESLSRENFIARSAQSDAR